MRPKRKFVFDVLYGSPLNDISCQDQLSKKSDAIKGNEYKTIVYLYDCYEGRQVFQTKFPIGRRLVTKHFFDILPKVIDAVDVPDAEAFAEG